MAVEIRNVNKSYETQSAGKATTALQDVSLTVPDGEFVTFLGPSGCGKSTLLNLIAGLGRPDTGSIQVGGQPVTGPSQDRLMIFQEAALFPWLTVLQNVEFGLQMQKRPPAEVREQALHYLQTVHLGKFLHSYPHELSGGMRQRAAIARALANDPPVLVGDEPTGNLDSRTAESVFALFERLVSTGKTILMVTHDPDLARRTRKQITVADGEIVQGVAHHD